MFTMDIGIDLGTANILIFIKGKGIVLREPAVVAVDRDSNRVLAVGEEARNMIGRTPGNIVAIRPLRDGVIANFDITEAMIRYFIEKIVGKSFVFRPRIMICIPSGVTMVEQRAVQEAAEQAGARKTYLIEEPLAAALGAGLDISDAYGSMVVDIGGGTTDIAVISLGGIVLSDSLRIASDKFDEAIIDYVKRTFNLMIGERTAEDIKINVGAAFEGARHTSMDVRGRDLLTGLPKVVKVDSTQIAEALSTNVGKILAIIKKVLEECPPELAADIMDRGIILTGGGSMLYGLDEFIRRETQIPTSLADDALSCVALGTGKALDNLDKLDDKRSFGFWRKK
ncbi:MAG: rod shape-determining protein [Selenomonadales bacterium]|nr:rod shape-determining protein [Selenomonadales bacterium]MDD6218513.1 rod shape-determining protein [Selenomonadaceae bacterium]